MSKELLILYFFFVSLSTQTYEIRNWQEDDSAMNLVSPLPVPNLSVAIKEKTSNRTEDLVRYR